MGHSNESYPLGDAIRSLTPSDKWAALVKITGGSYDAVMSALSGHPAGRLLLDAEIATKSMYAETERKRVRAFEKLQAEIIACLDAARRSGGLVLEGYTVQLPSKRIQISPDLPLEYDFINSAARSGDLQFHGVTVRTKSYGLKKAIGASSYPRVSDAELGDFCRARIAGASAAPSMDALWDAAKSRFVGKHVARARVRRLHEALIPPLSRKRGPRKSSE